MAGVNKFDTPAQAQFMNTYVPIPFAEMQQAVATRQGRLDENMAKMDAANIQAQNLNYISNSEDEAYIKGVVQPGMENIVTEFSGQDLSDPTVYNALRAKMSSTFDKSRVKDIQSSYTGWKQNQAAVGKLKAAGKYQEALDLMNPAKGYDSRKGVYDYQTESALDIRKAAEQYFNNLRADTGWNKETGEVWSGISDAKIQQSATENIRTFLDSKEGEQAVRIAAHRMGVDYNKISREDREGFAMDVLMEVGDEFGYSSTTPMPGYASYMKSQQQPDVNPWVNAIYKGTSMKIADNPELKLPDDLLGIRPAPATSATIAGLTTQKVTASAEERDVELSRVQELYEDTREKYPAPADVTDEAYKNSYNTAINAVNNQAISFVSIPIASLPEIKSQIKANAYQSNVTLFDSKGVSQVKKVNEVLDDLGWNKKQYEEFLDTHDPQLTFDGPESSMWAYQVPGGKKDEPRVIMFSASDQMGSMGMATHELNQRQRTLDDTPVQTKWGVAIRSVPEFDYKNSEFIFNLEEGDIVNGQFIKTGNFPGEIEDITRQELYEMPNSGVIGSDINRVTGPNVRELPFTPQRR